MDIKEFISNFAEQFDDLDASVLTPETEFKQLEDWNSLVALSVIAMIDEEYDVTLKGNDITGAKTIQELFNTVKSKM
jgi:acyl carrier protein